MSGSARGGLAPCRLIVLAGLPGTGKSELARELSRRIDSVWLRVDTIEASMLKAGVPRSFETGLAAYLVARDLGRDHLQLGRDVVVDAVNGVEAARRMWRELAEECASDRYVIEVTCSDAREHRRRVESRDPPTPPLPPPTWEEILNREYEDWREPTLRVDGMLPPAQNVSQIIRYVGGSETESWSRPRSRKSRSRQSSLT